MRLWPSGASQFYRPAPDDQELFPPGPRAIAVASGKGGVGKTSLSVNLALCLAKMGRRITLFDADLGLANAEVLLGLITPYTLHDVLFAGKTLDDIAVQGPLGVKVISSGSGLLELANLDQGRRRVLLQALNRYCDRQEFVLIDTGAGINKNVLGFVAAADEVVVVATPEPTSLTDAYALIKVLAKYKVHSQVNLVVNRAADRVEARHTFERLQAAADRFLEIKLKHLGWLPEDRLVAMAVKRQSPFFLSSPSSGPSRGVAGIAATLAGETQPASGNGFWAKLMGLFG